MFRNFIIFVGLLVYNEAVFLEQTNGPSILAAYSEDFSIVGFDIKLNERFFMAYKFAKSLHIANCSVIFDFDKDTSIQPFPVLIEKITFQNVSLKRFKHENETEAPGLGFQNILKNFKEVVYDSCRITDAIFGATYFLNPETITHFKMYNTHVYFFSKDSFYDVPELVYVEVRASNIPVYPGLFVSNYHLKHLEFPGNDFNSLVNYNFQPGLEFLDISDGRGWIVCSTIQNLKNLISLNMSHTRTIFSEAGCFGKHLRSIKTLDFSRNRMEKLLNNFVSGLPTLRKLYLNDNRLSFIEKGALYNLKELEILDLSNNKFTFINDVFRDMISLKLFFIGGNFISKTTAECVKNEAFIDDNYRNNSCLNLYDSLKHVKLIF